ncbi:GGDEF domain-containing protein, diguanylate cyclase (c-di-GMP synthetase) or its enzymatically inactive variants [Oceanospirillum multiglobuliferum]|uniref:GGDEF domain-containing protein n=1 Tax=Oceanospirillum multiglobuliferum TaxID=64969 RepID=A0A1T4N514_9GAMM|nr:hypothetical protein [Oceanospirillum multiglobuliferum]OPX55833.1 hypothetical protein BTE48_06425 [Oceanospirillum multiglobuliferum]SJZ74085.1 GGDEF domain-containing protein, diguanylate cyclase (c-di-GMP synthetase) or its enzymatically inactive variants [Oceanospirillum multiglobuliferum]
MDTKYKARLHALYFIFAGIGTLILGGVNYLHQSHLSAWLLDIGGFLLLSCGVYNFWRIYQPSRIIPFLILLFFGGLSIAGQWQPTILAANWAYLLPLYLFSLLAFQSALTLIMLYAVIFTLSTTVQLDGIERLQVLFLFWSATTIACVLIFTSRERQHHLQKLVSIDAESGAYNEQQLIDDLPRELARADRENTSLTILCVQSRNSATPISLQKINKKLKAQLRPFDRVYRYQNQLVALLPSAHHADNLKLCEKFQISLDKSIALAAVIPNEHDNEQDILRKTTLAMQKARGQETNTPLCLISDFDTYLDEADDGEEYV